MDFIGDDFTFYCPVCDREISQPESEIPAPLPSPALSSSSKVKVVKSVESNGDLGPRRKSSTRLSASKGKTHGRTKSKSHVNKSALTASTPLVPVTPILSEPVAEFNPPSSLYCSTECARIDELRSRLSFADLGPAVSSLGSFTGALWKGKGREEASAMSRRRSSGVSQKSDNSVQSDYFTQLQAVIPPTDLSSLPSLDFSTRRSSKGSEGGYSYRPNFGGKLSSDDGNSSNWGYGRTRGSSDSLVSLNNDSDERSTTHVRPPSALSSLRFMTPISPLPVNSRTNASPSHPRPIPLVRSNTDYSGFTAIKGSVAGPPLPSPRVLDRAGRSESDPGIDYSEMPPPPLPSSQSTTRSISSSYNTTPRNPPRTLSSASLALMNGSFTPASVESGGWLGPKRSESTASLSGLIAVGRMVSDSKVVQVPSGTRRERGRATGIRGSPASSASTSSFPRSLSSARSTAGSSDWHPVIDARATSPSGVSGRSSSQGRRFKGGLLMTPSTSSISSSSNEYSYKITSTDRTALEKLAQTHVRNLSKEEKTPTQSYTSSIGVKGRIEESERTVRRKGEKHVGFGSNTLGVRSNSFTRSSSPASPLIRGPTSSSPNLVRNNSHFTLSQRRESFNAEHVASLDPTVPGRKNWSWEGDRTYTALDVTKNRKDKIQIAEESKEPSVSGGERKRLFYFNDE